MKLKKARAGLPLREYKNANYFEVPEASHSN
jgi:hypothetical protein